MARYLVGIVALVLVAGGAYFYVQQNPAEIPDTGTDVAQTIRYTDKGYEPRDITISRGEAVLWVNESSRPMWPASAVHPTHSLYPQKDASDCLGSSFDACRELARGESWRFRFNEAGTWKFHDHIRPSETGTVIVE